VIGSPHMLSVIGSHHMLGDCISPHGDWITKSPHARITGHRISPHALGRARRSRTRRLQGLDATSAGQPPVERQTAGRAPHAHSLALAAARGRGQALDGRGARGRQDVARLHHAEGPTPRRTARPTSNRSAVSGPRRPSLGQPAAAAPLWLAGALTGGALGARRRELGVRARDGWWRALVEQL